MARVVKKRFLSRFFYVFYCFLFYFYFYTMLGVAEPDKVLDDIQSERIIILLCTTTEH